MRLIEDLLRTDGSSVYGPLARRAARRLRLLLVLGPLLGALAGAAGVVFLRAGIERQDARIEREAVYGTPPNYAEPWGPEACGRLATAVAMGRMARIAGGRKSAFMASIAEELDRDAPSTEEALREISDSWDQGVRGSEFYRSCLRRLRNHLEGKTS